MNGKKKLTNLALSSLFLALAYVLPFVTGQIQQIGNMLCPMHIPVLLCGFICGAPWGAAVGLIAPLLRSLTLGMPVLFPNAVSMAMELCTYGCVSGILFSVLPKKNKYIYVSLISAMVSGRAVWGIMQFVLMGLDFTKFGFSAFIAGAFTNAIPGIILQLVLVPVLVIFIKSKFPEKTADTEVCRENVH